jgi:hypothetical protein
MEKITERMIDMAFKLIKCGGESVPQETKYLMTDNEGCTRGQGLALTNGRLTNVAATAVPEYIAEKTVAAAAASVTPVPVHRVKTEYEYEVACTGQIATTVLGDKVTIHTDGLSVTATTTNGVFEPTCTDGAATSLIRGHF